MRITKHMIRLYPRQWRNRYGEEFLDLLEQRPLSILDGVDLVFGALDAHLHPHFGMTALSPPEKDRQMILALRSSLLILFCSFVGFMIAGTGFQKMTEEAAFQQATQTSNLVGLPFYLVVAGAIATLIAMIIGGLPIVIAIIKLVFVQKRYNTLAMLAVPPLAFLIFLGTTLLLEVIEQPHTESIWQILLYRSLFFGTLIIAIISSTGAVCTAVAQSEIPEKLLFFALLPFACCTIAMTLVLLAIILWGLGLHASAPQLFTGNAGILRTSTTWTWVSIVLEMILATGLAIFALIRGLSARSILRKTII